MNKILIVDGKVKDKTLNENIILTEEDKIKIEIKQNSDLTIEYKSKEKTKLDININIDQNVKCNIYEIKQDYKYKLQYKINIDKNSTLNLYHINDIKKIKQSLEINLNGENSKINYILKTISKNKEKYNLIVYHNAKNTESNIINNGVNIKDGELTFNVSGYVPNNIIDCILNQNNRIINLTKNKCMIKPNLFISENDVIANHSAHIGKCNDEEMFYLMSRGINKKQAENLIIKGFLQKELTQNKEIMEKIINKYWR